MIDSVYAFITCDKCEKQVKVSLSPSMVIPGSWGTSHTVLDMVYAASIEEFLKGRGIIKRNGRWYCCDCDDWRTVPRRQMLTAVDTFADVAESIPHNWPGSCALEFREDDLPLDDGCSDRNVNRYLSYFRHIPGEDFFPTISQWRMLGDEIDALKLKAEKYDKLVNRKKGWRSWINRIVAAIGGF